MLASVLAAMLSARRTPSACAAMSTGARLAALRVSIDAHETRAGVRYLSAIWIVTARR